MKKTNEGFYVIENDTHAGKCIEEYKGLDKINLNEGNKLIDIKDACEIYYESYKNLNL